MSNEVRSIKLAIEDLSIPPLSPEMERVSDNYRDSVKQWIRTGKVTGALAFKASEVLLEGSRLWHGTLHDIPAVVAPGGEVTYELRPSLPKWRDGQGRTYAHGDEPVVCLADVPNFPITRALVRPEGPKGVFSHRPDARRRRWSIISREYYEWACEQQVTGKVYGAKRQSAPEYWRRYADPLLGTLDEYRIPESVVADLPVQVSMEDLPNTTLVLDGSIEKSREFSRFLPRYVNPVALADELGLGLLVPGGDLPLDLHPYNQR